MADKRQLQVHFLPGLAPTGGLQGTTAVAIDVLRATTTMVTALASGCTDVRPCGTVEEARELAAGMPAGRVLLGGDAVGSPFHSSGGRRISGSFFN